MNSCRTKWDQLEKRHRIKIDNRFESNWSIIWCVCVQHMHAHNVIISHAGRALCIHVWGGGGCSMQAAGRWEELTAPAEQPAAPCVWISSFRKSAQENRFALSEPGQPWGDKLICFTESKWPVFVFFPSLYSLTKPLPPHLSLIKQWLSFHKDMTK